MDVERVRAYLLSLPHVVETLQWGANLVFWVGDKAIGGKMFAVIDLDEPAHPESAAARKPRPHLSYAAGSARFSELVEIDGLMPAPYFARAYWVGVLHWDVFTPSEWHRELRAAHEMTFAKLPPKTRKALALPVAEQKRLISARRKLLAVKAKKERDS
jgi:predicted DNA-binding protein (MmcQ/YjbR family)